MMFGETIPVNPLGIYKDFPVNVKTKTYKLSDKTDNIYHKIITIV